MAASSDRKNLRVRRRYQHQVDALLAELAERRQRIMVLRTWGFRPADLRELKASLQAVRRELAAATGADSASRPAEAA